MATALISCRGGPRHGPPHPPTLGRAPAKPWRASTLPPHPPTLGRAPAKPWRASTLPPHPPTLGRAPAKPWRASTLTQDVSLRVQQLQRRVVESAVAHDGIAGVD